MEDIYEEIYSLVRQIPEGMISTYKQVAEALSDPIAARGVAEALSLNPCPIEVPCHRVVHENLELGGFRFGVKEKKAMLMKEGICIDGEKVRGKVFADFRSTKSLVGMRKLQEEMAKKVDLCDSDFELVAGFDVSYKERLAKGALCVMNRDMEVIEVRTGYALSRMPYIPTYLGFREMSLFEELSKGLKDILYFIDGNGVMHPRFCGSACMMGVKTGAATIGVAKSRLFGRIEGEKVFYGEKQIGWKSGNRFLSPGHRVSRDSARAISAGFSLYSTPEPLRLAHFASRINLNKRP
jgi:deoxyribonuclease V